MNIFYYFIISIILFLPAEEGWQLKKDKEGIKIYTRDVQGSSFKEFKALTTVIGADIFQVLNVIFDVKNYDRLFPDCSDQKMLKEFSEYHNIQYLIIHTPWPVSDRDNVSELQAHFSKDSSGVAVSIKLLPDYIEKKKGLVRLREGKGFWKLKKLNNNRVEVIYQYHSNPGGNIPSWLANSFVVNHPYKTLQNLKKRVLKNNQ
jgi:hypothetical protein